ncbi:FAD-binding and (Fe-S)-binding domain-containing protein [Anaerobiospirillum succiniciproducens]|uniref:FAD-binding and (Fe-S)-binding domain-containing protein n=1 Tax=Anaerobiospirillum succiniciproducens TaxID=13335 RepID=UPI003F892308
MNKVQLKLDFEGFAAKAKEHFNDRVYTDFLRRFAYGTDASCYRYIPKVVIRAFDESEIQTICALAQEFETPLTFRAAGTSLSGQASSESVLVIANARWQKVKVSDDKKSIFLDCGVIGCEANEALKPYSLKIGPDPATINNAMIGGIFNNNSSGMCCGVKQNSYNTIKSVRVILRDGTILDTSDNAPEGENLASFVKTHGELVEKLMALRNTVVADKELVKLIERKFKIKNTTGYSINSLVDFSELKDILNHIFIGSEGTLAFTSRVEYECVEDSAFKSCALLHYASLDQAAVAVKVLAKNQDIVSSAEIMDYQCLKSAQDLDNAPAELKDIKEGQCALLVQLEAADKATLDKKIAKVTALIEPAKSIYGTHFDSDPKKMESNWTIRKSILPLSASLRPSGTAVITEDVCYPTDNFAKGIAEITELFKKYDFVGSIFGHALAGNVHFIITPDLSDPDESARFAAFMEALVESVCALDGSTKAEHGTGRMVAPFVEREWGKKAYQVNVAIKELFDPKYLINPDVIITDDMNVHNKNFKTTSQVEDFIDKCMECGFCEKVCPSRELTLTPRQRIAVRKEIVRLENMNHRTAEESAQLEELKKGYEYFGIETCATCSMCSTLCPLEIDTAKIALSLKPFMRSPFRQEVAKASSKIYGTTIGLAKASLMGANAARTILGSETVTKISRKMNETLQIPFVPVTMPKSNGYSFNDKIIPGNDMKVIYFTSCINRVFAPRDERFDKRPLQEVFEGLCKKAGIDVVYPHKVKSLCCGKSYKDYPEVESQKATELQNIIHEMAKTAKNCIVVCDHSACSYEILKRLKESDSSINFMDMPVFLEKVLLERISIRKIDEDVAVYPMCSTVKGKWDSSLKAVAQACTTGKVYVHSSTKCCGFAGNKGFTRPELNDSALRLFNEYYDNEQEKNPNLKRGYSSSSTCEIGLNSHSDIAWQNLIYLVDKVARYKM